MALVAARAAIHLAQGAGAALRAPGAAGGGQGAARELCELIMHAQGTLEAQTAAHRGADDVPVEERRA